VRLFVAAEVPEPVRTAVVAVERPPGADVRWAAPSAWHVTLRFLGEVGDPAPALAALAAVEAASVQATVGRTPERLGPTAVVLPVEGLAEVAGAVARAFDGIGGAPGEGAAPFRGHLTLGRLRRPGRWPRGGVGVLAAEVHWTVGEVALVRSHLGGGPARYEVLATRLLG
jgi:2'-5' RNA ligase